MMWPLMKNAIKLIDKLRLVWFILTIDIVDKGFYIGNNQFLDEFKFKLLKRILDENTSI